MIGRPIRFLTYEAGNSLPHRLDPRTKLLAAALITVDALAASIPAGIAAAYVLGAAIGVLAFPVLLSLWRVLRPLLVLIAVFGLLVTITTPGHALAHVWIVVPTSDGVNLAIRLALQVLLIVYVTSLVTLTTPPLAIAAGLQWTFGPLERIKLPVRDVISMVAIGLTFVPLLIGETQKVIAAQRARGADLGMNAMLEEDSMGALLVPLLLANLRRGDELAESMEARLYGVGPRSSLHEQRVHRIDLWAVAVLVLGSVLVFGLSFVWPR